MYVNGGREHVEIMFDYERNFFWQRNFKKTKKRREGFGLLYNHQQAETLSI